MAENSKARSQQTANLQNAVASEGGGFEIISAEERRKEQEMRERQRRGTYYNPKTHYVDRDGSIQPLYYPPRTPKPSIFK